MHILIVSSEFPPGPGGIGTHAFELARHLNSSNNLVTVIAQQDYASDKDITIFNTKHSFSIERLESTGMRWHKAWHRFRKIQQVVCTKHPDILLATGKYAVWIASLAAKKASIPLIAVGHGTEFTSTNAIEQVLSRITYSRADGVINVSSFTECQMRKLKIRPRRSWVIHNGADAERFRPISKQEADRFVTDALGLEKCRIISTVGRVCERKGQHIVIQSLQAILEQVPDVHYVIAGLPEQRLTFASLAQRVGVAKHVHFLGQTSAGDVVRLLNASDLFVMTSTKTINGDIEGFGIAVVEAALCGTPAIVSKGFGLTEAILEGETGISVLENDIAATASTIASLLMDDTTRIEMGRKARLRAEREQTWQQVAKNYEQVLRKCVRGNHQ